jgi:serine/threonine-protein kinase
MTLELVEGHSLGHYIESGQRFSESEAAHIGVQVLEALDHLAGVGILHRDVKPTNILRVNRNQVKLSDFGLCLDTKKQNRSEDLDETTCGTVEYLSPEQAMGRADLDPRADQYSLGTSLFHIIAGHLPFHGSTQREIMEKHIKLRLDFTGFERWFSPPMRAILERMMAKERDDRYRTPRAAIDDLQKIE